MLCIMLFEIASDGQEQWQGVLNNVENLQKAFGPTSTEIEVVAHGKGLGLLLVTNTDMQERLTGLAQSGVTLAACENTMRRLRVSKNDMTSSRRGSHVRAWSRLHLPTASCSPPHKRGVAPYNTTDESLGIVRPIGKR